MSDEKDKFQKGIPFAGGYQPIEKGYSPLHGVLNPNNTPQGGSGFSPPVDVTDNVSDTTGGTKDE